VPNSGVLDLLAKQLVAEREYAGALEQELERTPKWRFRRRAALGTMVERVHSEERTLVTLLGGHRPQSENRTRSVTRA
jgi:hypothetical protein